MKVPSVAAGVVCLCVLAGSAHAHHLGVECKLRDGQVEVEAFYDDDTTAKNAQIEALDSDKKVIASGRTDAQGRWAFPAPGPGTYQIVVDAGAGHRTTVRMVIPGGKPTAPEAARTVSEAGTREEFTTFPWLGAGLGLGIIAGLSLLLWLALTRLRATPGRTAP